MDKSDVKVHENHSDTSSVITMKEYAPSEYPSSEPPPAYIKPRSNALRIAKLAAFTVIVSSIILGGFILAASWIQANTARNLDLTLNQELFDDLHPSYEHLVANEVLPEQQHNSLDQAESKTETSDENKVALNAEKLLEKINQSNDEGLVPPPPPLSVPMKAEEKKVLDMDEIANILMQKNIKGNVNCIVEKRKNEELVDHAPMSLNLPTAHLPFGVNITTPPRLQHLTGERMIVICKGDEDEEKDSSIEEGENDKAEEIQQIVFPLPNNLITHIQQIPQIIPLSSILHHLHLQQPLRQIPVQQLPAQPIQIQQLPLQQPLQMQQIPFQQLPVQQLPVQQLPVQQIQFQQVPPQLFQQVPIQRFNIPNFQSQQPQVSQQPIQQPQQIFFRPHVIPEQQQRQPQQQQIFFPQKVFVPQPQMVNNQPNVPIPEIVPLKEISINQNRVPVNHVFHNRVPINPMAVNDIPISRMQITHLPLRSEPQIKEEPIPVHHLMPPQPQQQQVENFRQEGPRFNERPIQIFPPQPNQIKQFPVEVNDPGVLRVPPPLAQESREQFPISLRSNRLFVNNLVENREPEFAGENRAFRPLTVDVRPRGQRREPMFPEISRIIPLNFERRPVDNGRRIRFPDMVESEPPRENRLPIITEITKIIPIRLEKEETEINEVPMSQPKSVDVSEIKLEKMPPRPFPIPINAILDMIFKGIRPLMNNRENPFPVPIDIKIERIDNKPLGLMDPPFFKKFEIIKKESQNSVEEEDSQNPQMDEKNESEENNEEEKEVVEAKIKGVEAFDGENENGHPEPIDVQDPQVLKMEDQGKQTPEANNEQSSFEDQAFLPNGQGRGARVFPIPQVFPIRPKEAEIFSVSDAKSDKNSENAEVPVESSLAVTGSAETDAEKPEPETADNRQGRFLDFQNPFINLFPISNKPIDTASEARSSVKLLPVTDAGEKAEKPVTGEANEEETRPHFVQPRSV